VRAIGLDRGRLRRRARKLRRNQLEPLSDQNGPFVSAKRNQAQENATSGHSQTDPQAPTRAQTATMTTLTTAWHGTGRETESLLEAVAHNCGCEFGVAGIRMSTCGAHQMLVDDERALNGLLFGRFLAPRLFREEMGV
jgi:hypothetical protein